MNSKDTTLTTKARVTLYSHGKRKQLVYVLFWLDDMKAPDYARVVDIHKKPGYDPVEMFMTSKLRAGYKLLRKKARFRYVMNVIPLDATLVKGSHGRIGISYTYKPIPDYRFSD